MSLDELIKKNAKKSKTKEGPLWKGPENPEGGITQSMLAKFLCCRERFRLLVVEGLKPEEHFNAKIEFGQMWHTCEEAFAVSGNPIVNNPVASPPWLTALTKYCKDLAKRYPTQQEQVQHWYGITKMQFPLYIKHWQHHPDVKDRTPLFQEQVFCVPYELPSGRTVYLRGKWDSVDLIGKVTDRGIFLQENKTKQRIDEQKIKRQLTFDLQTMLYLVSIQRCIELDDPDTEVGQLPEFPLKTVSGVRYNVIRRTEHRVGKKETEADFLTRLKGIIEASPHEWFMRWKVEVSQEDIARFRREFLDPILGQLCWWWELVTANGRTIDMSLERCHAFINSLNWRHPFGCENYINEGGSGDLDEYLESGSTLGLRKVETLFPELA